MTPPNHALQRFALLHLLLLTILAGSGCSTTRITDSQRDDINEALFRHIAQPAQVVNPDSHGINLAHKVLFLEIEDQDPSPELLQRLKAFPVPVKPISASVSKNSYIYDRATNERGAAFHLHSIKRLSRSKVEVQGDTLPGGVMRGSGHIYRLVYRDGKWSVVGEKKKWVS